MNSIRVSEFLSIWVNLKSGKFSSSVIVFASNSTLGKFHLRKDFITYSWNSMHFLTRRFKTATFFGDTITARARVAEKIEYKRWVRMALTWTNHRGKTVAKGEAVVIPLP